jgi:hypothetical protein
MIAMGSPVLVTLATEAVAQTVPANFPLAIICWNERTQGWAVGYLTTVNRDGSATYMPPGGNLAARVNARGVVDPPRNRPAVFDCGGKNLDELRAMGRVIEFQHAR